MPDIDHRIMLPPFLRTMATLPATPGASFALWDLRIAQPNVSHVSMPALHSLEHLLGSALRDQTDLVLNVGLMGCQTGVYISALVDDFDHMADLLETALLEATRATTVPLANPVECGWAAHHSLEGAQELAAWLLNRRADWRTPSH